MEKQTVYVDFGDKCTKEGTSYCCVIEALEGNQKAEKAVSDLTATQLNVDDGIKVSIDKLDTAFQAETTDDAYSAYTEFNNYKKGHNTSISDYVLEFKHLNHKILEYDMKLPDTVLAFKLLDGAGLSEQQQQMALTVASDSKFETMRSALKEYFPMKHQQTALLKWTSRRKRMHL